MCLACLLATNALAECVPNASVMKAAAAEVAHEGGPRCRLPGCSCRCCRARGTLGSRTPGCRRAPQAPVKWWVETLSRCAVKAMRPSAPGRLPGSRSATEGSASWGPDPHSSKLSKVQGRAGSSLPGSEHAGSSPTGQRLRRLSTIPFAGLTGHPEKVCAWGVDSVLPVACLCARTGRRSQDPCSIAKTQTPGSKPTPPLATGSGAHGLCAASECPCAWRVC